jgi:hypothetical protein
MDETIETEAKQAQVKSLEAAKMNKLAEEVALRKAQVASTQGYGATLCGDLRATVDPNYLMFDQVEALMRTIRQFHPTPYGGSFPEQDEIIKLCKKVIVRLLSEQAR